MCISFLSAALYQVAYGPVPTRGPEVGDHWFRSRENKEKGKESERRKSILFCATALCGGSADVESVQESCFEAGSWISVKMTLFIKLHECSGSIQIIQEIASTVTSENVVLLMFCFWDLFYNQGEEADFLPAGACCVRQRRSALHAAREVAPPCRARGQPRRRVQENLRNCRGLSRSRPPPSPVPQHVSRSALLRVRAALRSTIGVSRG